MHEVNMHSFSKNHPNVKMIKLSVDHVSNFSDRRNFSRVSHAQLTHLKQAVQEMFGKKAHVQLQGSVGKGTGMAGLSDLDLFVMLAADITVTKEQRKQLMDRVLVLNAGSYQGSLRENRVYLFSVLDRNLPTVDIVFERYKAVVKIRDEPNANLSESHEAQIVTKYLKALPHTPDTPQSLLGGFTNLGYPSYPLERFVILVEAELASNGHPQRDLTGAQGVALLLQTCLEKIGLLKQPTPNQLKSLEDAEMLSNEHWANSARRCLNKLLRL